MVLIKQLGGLVKEEVARFRKEFNIDPAEVLSFNFNIDNDTLFIEINFLGRFHFRILQEKENGI